MQRYQVVVNGNTYTVTVKSLVGNTAIVDVDGWEFQVAIGESEGAMDFTPLVAAATGASAGAQTGGVRTDPKVPAMPLKQTPIPDPEGKGRKRASALEELGPKKASTPQVSGKGVITAHLPGQIVEIGVKVGDVVRQGDMVCKMEAMKMVNEVKSTVDGVVQEILVQEQQNVLENQPLMIIEC